MRRRVGLSARSPKNNPLSALLSLSLSTALVLLPVLPARAAATASAPARESAPTASAHTAAPAAPLAAPSLTATKTDSFADPDGDGKAEPGQTITYTVTINNTGTDASNVVFTDTVDPNTTLVPNSVRTQPVAANESYSVLGNVRISVPDGASDLLGNDCDADNGGPCSSAGLTASGPTTSTQGGNVTVNADGSFSYNPPAGFEGADTFTYTVTDATGLSDTATVTLNVSDVVWFVDNSAATNGDGRLTSPFNTLAPLGGGSDPDEPDDVIFVHEGNAAYAGGIVLENNQRLVGQGTSLDAALAAFGIAVPAHSDARPAPTGNPTIANAAGDAVALASSNTVLYVDASASMAGSSAIHGNGVGGSTLISGANAIATVGANGVRLQNVAGPFAMTGGSVAANSTGVAVAIDGGAAGVTFTNTSVSQNVGRVVDIQNRAGGSTVHFAGASPVTGTNGATDAVFLLNNAATAAITFSAPVSLSTTASGARGLFALGGFTLNVGPGSTVSSTGGAAVDIEDISANINFSTTFSTSSNGSGVRVKDVSGAASFGSTTVNASAAVGIVMSDNSAAVTFSDLDIAPAAGQRALHATNNTGAITSSTGTITTTNETAVEITGQAVGNRTPLNIQLESLSADGGNTVASGLVLTNTSAAGSPGGFRVNGTGTTDGSGGTVQNTTTRGANVNNAASVALKNMNFTSANSTVDGGNVGACDDLNIAGCNSAIYLNNVAGATLDNVRLTGTMVENGVTAVSVSDLKLDNSLLEGCGNEANESCFEGQNLSGTSTVAGTEIRFSATNSFDVVNVGTNWTLTVSNSVFRDTQTTLANVANILGDGGLQFRSGGTAPTNATTTINVLNSSFLRLRTQAIQGVAEQDSVLNVDVFGNTIDSGAGAGTGVDLNANHAAQLRFNILNNPAILSRGGAPVNITSFGSSQVQGRVNDNPNVRARGTGIGLRLLAEAASTMIAEARRNTVVVEAPNSNNAIDAQARLLTARLDLTLDDNTTTVQTNAVADINLTTGQSTANEQSVLCANLVSNNASGTGAARALRLRVSDLDATSDPKLYLQGFVEAGTPNQDAEATWNGNGNTPASVANSEVITSLTAGATHPGAPPTGSCQFVTIPADLAAAPAPAPAMQIAVAAEAAPARATVAAAVDTQTGFSPARGFFGSNLWPRKAAGAFSYFERAQSAAVVAAAQRVETARTTTASSYAPVLAGETVNVPVGTLRAGDSVTITFQVTVANPVPAGTTQVSNQGTVTADGGVSVQTDDPTVGGANDPTVTPLLLPPTIKVNDATVVEPASGSANMLFTVTLSHPYTQTVSADFDTANGGANPADATDYTATSGSVSFAAGETVKTVSVPVLADGSAGEGSETFLVNLSGAVNGTVGDGSATGTITDESIASAVIISELRTSGPAGAGDDFVELLNTTDADVTVPAGGYVLVASGAACTDTPTVVATIPAGAVIPARGNYLLKGSAYSLAAYAAGDQTLSADIADDSNVGLFSVGDLASIGSANRLDAVGFGGKETDNCDLLREGTTLSNAAGSTSEYSFVRKVEKGATADTTDNAADFVLVSTTPNVPVGSATPTLGAPGPEGAANPRGPVPCSATTGAAKFGRELIDPTVGAAAAPNVARDTTAVTGGPLGTLDFRRTFTNNTGSPVTALRFRVVNMATGAGAAGLRAHGSSAITVATAAGNKTVQGTSLESPSPASSGGVNSTLAVGTVTLGSPLAAGASVNLRFLFGVEQAGDYEIGFVIESSPASGKDFWKLAGHTETGGHTDGGCNKPPVANAGLDVTAQCSGGEASVSLDGSASTDPDGDTPLTYEWSEGGNPLGTGATLSVTLPLGPHTITLTVTDPSGDSSQDTVAVNVVDTIAPAVTPPADVTVFTGPNADSCGTTVGDGALGTASAADSCEGALPVNRTGVPAGNFFPVGPTVITYTATDAAGNTGSATQTVTVIDNTAPTVTAPANVVAPNDAGSCSAVVNPGTATASDNCNVQSVVGTRSDNQPLNAAYPVGTTTITWKATDVNGNTATATQSVTVQDAEKPSLLSSVAVVLMGPPFNHALINVGLSATASDNCSGIGPYQVSVFSDEDDGPAPHSPDAATIGLGTLRLRRERNGEGDGRVYLVVVKVTDAAGNTSASCSTVGVPLSNSSSSVASVNAQAASAASFCTANNGAAPAGFFAVGP